MSEAKYYEEGGLAFEFVPDGSPFEGRLVARFPELPPYIANINLSSSRSRNGYAREGAEYCGVDESALKGALIGVCARRDEEVAAAKEAEQEEESDQAEDYSEITDEEIDERVGRPGVLGRYVEDAATISRVVKERSMLKLIALGALSAQLDLLPNGKPLGSNILVTGPPGRGKNYLPDAVARLLPEWFYFAFESASAKALYYAAANNPAFLKHRWAYPNEAEATDLLVELLRPLLSGGSARHITVNRDDSGRSVGQEFTIEGPITVTIPTVRNKLDDQLQTRTLVAGLEDYEGRVADHSGAVSQLLSSDYAGTDYTPEIRAWQAALVSLTGVRRVVTPVEYEGFRFDSDEVSHGARLWTNLLGLMCAHAWLEQRNRELRDLPSSESAIVASPEDYEAAYEIFKETCERSIVNLSGAHRKILNAAHELQEDLESEGKFLPSAGFTQRKIAAAAGVSQSTISDNKTFLVKSAKLMRQTDEGGLLLVEGADPSWWEKGDVLGGFPRPEEVKTWWTSDTSAPAPEGADRADHDVDEAETPHGEGAKGDPPPTDGRAEASDHPRADDRSPHRDREGNGDDREAADREDGLSKPDVSPDGEVIGTIGGSGEEDAKSVPTSPNEEGYDGNPSDRVPHPQKERQEAEKDSGATPVENPHEEFAKPPKQNVATDDSIKSAPSIAEALPNELHGPECRGYSLLRIPPSKRGPLTERAARIEAILRRHYLDYPKDRDAYKNLGEGGIFEDLDFTPSYWEVYRVDRMISRISPGIDTSPPLEEAPVMETQFRLNELLPLGRSRHLDESDPVVLIDAVAASRLAFFVPTLAEMIEAMRRTGLEPAPVYSESEDSVSARTSACEISEVEEAIRDAQRAPRMLWPENQGFPNTVQEWVRRRGYSSPDKREALRDISSFLQREGYLASEPSTAEVRVVMDKLVTEIEEATARHFERERRRLYGSLEH